MILFPSLTGFIALISVLLSLHPIHVSVTEIEFDRKDQALEIMIRVFIDDLELTLRNSLNKSDLDILNLPTGTTVDQLASDYLSNHFRISLDNKAHKTTYLGHEMEGEAFIFYVEVSGVKPWKTIAIHNDIIMATYEDQSNLIHVYVDEQVKSLRLTRNTPADKLTFDGL